MMRNISLYLFVSLFMFTFCQGKRYKNENNKTDLKNWTIEQAKAWGKENGSLCGCNFVPSTAINQLEMWQSETFDTTTIDRELGWAQDIGMNCMRVFLHHLAWQEEKDGFKTRMEKYLEIANRHHIKTIFVFFDDCWNATYHKGKQPDPKIGIHNSGWVRDPGDLFYRDSSLVTVLESYVKDILVTFRNDNRIALWDLYNEPGNSGYGVRSMVLLKDVFGWAREISPSQPITAGVWNSSFTELNHYQLNHSDIITYHNYDNPEKHQKAIDTLKQNGRPMICTEYMARRNNSLFSNIMPLLKKEHVGAINWGLVSGKTNTIYAWDTPMPDGSEPALWFHDIFRSDGTPYKQSELVVIKNFTGVK